MSEPTKCKTHRQYQVIRKPRADCLDCWKMYAEKAEARADEAERLLAKCAQIARLAKLPDTHQWGEDAMESFDFGKERAAQAIERAALNSDGSGYAAVITAARHLRAIDPGQQIVFRGRAGDYVKVKMPVSVWHNFVQALDALDKGEGQ